MIDKAFDLVDDAIDAHVDEANAVITRAVTKIRDLIQEDGRKFVTQHTFRILRAIKGNCNR